MIAGSAARVATAVASAILLFSCVQNGAWAQNSSGYTVYATFIYARTGERTPQLLLNQSLKLTSYGAQQMFNMGSYFRNRYIGTGSQANSLLAGLDAYSPADEQVTIETPDSDYTIKSAQAFMSAFYPPYLYANSSTGGDFDPFAVMANNAYLDWPMGGYQYPPVQSFSSYDPQSIWINGGASCLNGDIQRNIYYNGSDYLTTYEQTLEYYRGVGSLFAGTNIDPSTWSYGEAWSVYELLDFYNRHNGTVQASFNPTGQYPGLLNLFSSFANEKLWSLYGNSSVSGAYPGDAILTIAGQTLAAKVLAQLQSSIQNMALVNKFTLVTGEFYPMMGLASLMGLGDLPSAGAPFRQLPPYGSAMVFEVFSRDPNASLIPDTSNLWVRFYFRNASDPTSNSPAGVSPDMTAYSIFGEGPSSTDISWTDFQRGMANIEVPNLDYWCNVCSGETLFCLPFLTDSSSSSNGSGKKGVSPAVGGVIGAIVTLAVAGLLAAALMFFCGLRVHRRGNRGAGAGIAAGARKSDLGGFKGSAKLASDEDLNIPKNGAPVGISVVEDDEPAAAKKGHERVGSWELKGQEKDGAAAPAGLRGGGGQGHERFASIGSTVVGRPSFERDHEEAIDEIGTPVKPRESV